MVGVKFFLYAMQFLSASWYEHHSWATVEGRTGSREGGADSASVLQLRGPLHRMINMRVPCPCGGLLMS